MDQGQARGQAWTEETWKGHNPFRLVIADDHPIFQEGGRRLLEAEPDYKVIGEASDGAEAVNSYAN